MTTLDTPLAATTDGTLMRLARLVRRFLGAIGREVAYMIAEDLAHGRIDSHRDEY